MLEAIQRPFGVCFNKHTKCLAILPHILYRSLTWGGGAGGTRSPYPTPRAPCGEFDDAFSSVFLASAVVRRTRRRLCGFTCDLTPSISFGILLSSAAVSRISGVAVGWTGSAKSSPPPRVQGARVPGKKSEIIFPLQ